MGEAPSPHVPVMVAEVLEFLQARRDGIYIDATVGGGGHAKAILSCGSRVVGVDCDGEALALAQRSLAAWSDRYTLFRANFTELGELVKPLGLDRVDGILLDLGLSSLQLQSRTRGFSFQSDGVLDMRMDDRLPLTAQHLLATASQTDLADIFWKYGGERGSRGLAQCIVRERRRTPLTTVSHLVRVIHRVIRREGGLHPATRAFQALRIAVNHELQNIETGLPNAFDVLSKEGRLVVVSYHSLEDRLVKHFFKRMQLEGRGCLLTPHPIRPSREEVQQNPRSRSARLRAIERVV